MAEIIIFDQPAVPLRRNAAATRHIPAEEEKLLRRMRRTWRRCEDMLSDIEMVKQSDDPDIADRTFRAWWSRQHRISWAGGKLIEQAIAYRMRETRAAFQDGSTQYEQSANDRRAG